MERFNGYVQLKALIPSDNFHRIYRGVHCSRRNSVILHLFDLSASKDKNADSIAKQVFETRLKLQQYAWAPRILDSLQEAYGYPGKMLFFSEVDPSAPTLEERCEDSNWKIGSRLRYTKAVLNAFDELRIYDNLITHWKPYKQNILVKSDNTPIFTELHQEYASASIPEGYSAFRSLCACLMALFEEQRDSTVWTILNKAMLNDMERRFILNDIEQALTNLTDSADTPAELLSARYWAEDEVVSFYEKNYRIVNRLNSNNIEPLFKVVELDASSKADIGTYVAKASCDQENGEQLLKSHTLARNYLEQKAELSPILFITHDWCEDGFISIRKWIDGVPLSEFAGFFPFLVEEQQETSAENMVLHWLLDICEILALFHRNGLIHGNVCLQNILLSDSKLTLINYDRVTRQGEPCPPMGINSYYLSESQHGTDASASDDIFALASSFFHLVYGSAVPPHSGIPSRETHPNWSGLNREEYPKLAIFLDKATHTNIDKRFATAMQAMQYIKDITGIEREISKCEMLSKHEQGIELREQNVEWLRSLLQSYPGSKFGNSETRGLDTIFAEETYVPTKLETTLHEEILNRTVRLVILCGNAGDGKTALLQHLAVKLGLGKHQSAGRIVEGILSDGLTIHINLDGSASWRGHSSDEILKEFLAPFQNGLPERDIVHLLAINDGRLLEWIETVENERGETPLTQELYAHLQREEIPRDSHIRFITLNQRSLVGGVNIQDNKISADFLERLVNHLYGGDQASVIWKPCITCASKTKCEVYRAARIFGPDGLHDLADKCLRTRARERLFEALQAVHLRGVIHLTMRELRSALVYILFGVHFCKDYFNQESNEIYLPYWDRAFAVDSLQRQGEALREISYFDPALDAHPKIDRYLLSNSSEADSKMPLHYNSLSLTSARRRAYFEWTEDDMEAVAGDSNALGLYGGENLSLFRRLPFAGERELSDIRDRLCKGISRLEDLPPHAYAHQGIIPLRILQRTPTETFFWVEKPMSSFHMEPDMPSPSPGLERLHHQAYFVYRYRDGKEERLRMGADLFNLLLELGDGYQLGDISTEDTFAQLSIFVQRLMREDEHELFAWNPMKEDAIYKVHSVSKDAGYGVKQVVKLTAISKEEDDAIRR